MTTYQKMTDNNQSAVTKEEIDANVKLSDEQWRNGATKIKSFPRTVTIETTGVCNLKCVMCPHGLHDDHEWVHFPEELVEKLPPIIKRAEVVQLHGTGEPLMNPSFWRMLDMTSSNQYVAINSNGILINKKNADRILDSWLSEVSFSMDAATPETYMKIRGADFSKVTENIRYLVDERNRRGQTHPLVHMNMTLMRENIEETPQFIKLAAQLGADKVMLWQMNTLPEDEPWVVNRNGWTFNYHEQHLSRHTSISNKKIKECVKLADELGVNLEMDWAKQVFYEEDDISANEEPTKDTSETNPHSTKECSEPWKWMLINDSGMVKPCCYGPAVGLGDLCTKSAGEIWNASGYRRLRQNNLNGLIDKACAHATCKFVNGRASTVDEKWPVWRTIRVSGEKFYISVKSSVRPLVGEQVWASLKKVYKKYK